MTVPSSSELNNLLRSLNPPAAPSIPIRPAGPSPKGSRHLIEPFGPVKDFTSPSAERKRSVDNLKRANSGDTAGPSASNAPALREGKEGDEGVQDVDLGSLPFVKCLPRLSELMGDEKFMLELRKVSLSSYVGTWLLTIGNMLPGRGAEAYSWRVGRSQKVLIAPDESRSRCPGKTIMG